MSSLDSVVGPFTNLQVNIPGITPRMVATLLLILASGVVGWIMSRHTNSAWEKYIVKLNKKDLEKMRDAIKDIASSKKTLRRWTSFVMWKDIAFVFYRIANFVKFAVAFGLTYCVLGAYAAGACYTADNPNTLNAGFYLTVCGYFVALFVMWNIEDWMQTTRGYAWVVGIIMGVVLLLAFASSTVGNAISWGQCGSQTGEFVAGSFVNGLAFVFFLVYCLILMAFGHTRILEIFEAASKRPTSS
jgi:hypothetical protein